MAEFYYKSLNAPFGAQCFPTDARRFLELFH